MAMKISDERREVAARLRTTKAECDERGYPWMVEDLLQALGFETYDDGDEGIFDLLADLIDPTCEREDEDTDEDSQYRGTSLCSECGELLISQFRYCPHCGARVTSGGEG